MRDISLILCYNVIMRTAFIGHRKLFSKNIIERLLIAIQNEIENGCTAFTMGTHGDFDRLALTVCRNLRKIYKNLEIEVVITSLNSIKRDNNYDIFPYADVKTVMFDIENIHYKHRITWSNLRMIDGCSTLICYVNKAEYKSGAKTALRYAEKRGLKIINLFREDDNPFFGMTKEQKEESLQSFITEKVPKK